MFSYFFMVVFSVTMQMKIWCKCKKPPSKSKRRFLHKYMYQNSLIFVMQLLQTRECSTSVILGQLLAPIPVLVLLQLSSLGSLELCETYVTGTGG